MVGVVLRFSSVASCAYTRGVRVESPIRPFLKAGFHLCECGRATRVIDRQQSREPVARMRDQWLEHAY